MRMRFKEIKSRDADGLFVREKEGTMGNISEIAATQNA